MNSEELREAAAVMLAAADGKVIQRRDHPNREWRCTTKPIWDWITYEYRIKPEPREVWVNEYSGGLSYVNYTSMEEANRRQIDGRTACVHFREVIED